jgi:hypothetical protein
MKLHPISAGEWALILHNSQLENEKGLIGLTVRAIKRVGHTEWNGWFVSRAWLVDASMYPSHRLYVDERALWTLRPKDGLDNGRHRLHLWQFALERDQCPAQLWALLVPNTVTVTRSL